MDTLVFLQTVLPSAGPYLLAVPASFVNDKQETINYFKHYGFDDLASMATAVAYTAENTKDELYFALGSFTQLPADLKQKPGQKGVRKQHNVAALRSFWCDLDVKPGVAGAYGTIEDAATAIKQFVTTQNMPRPFVVKSGGGLHCYWPLTEDIDADKWTHYANILKHLFKAAGVKADPSRTADCASVLRPVGAANWKTGMPRPVTLVVRGEVVTPKAFMTKLAMLAEQLALPVDSPAPRVQVEVNAAPLTIAGTAPVFTEQAQAAMAEEIEGGVGIQTYAESEAPRVAQRCAQIKWHAMTQGADATEPQWYDMLGCMRFCKDGEKAVHLLSSKHADYSAERVNSKIDQHVGTGVGPTTCERFELNRPRGCAGCPHLGKVKSPIVLGRELLAAPQPVVELQQDNGTVESFELPNPPAPYKRAVNPETGRPRIVMMVEDKDGDTFETVLYDHDLYPVSREWHEKDRKYTIKIRTWLPQDGWIEVAVDQGLLLSDRKAVAKVLGNAGIACEVSKIDYLVDYMLGYIRVLQMQAKANTIYVQLGFDKNHERFVLPDRILTTSGTIPHDACNEIKFALKQFTPPVGTLEGWTETANFFGVAGREAMQVLVMASFASPLFHFTGFNGGWLNVCGKAGSGKSLAMRCGAAVWGHPEMLWTSVRDRKENGAAVGDTLLAYYNLHGIAQYLPVFYDECTGLLPATAGAMAYQQTGGGGRGRMGQNGVAQEIRNQHHNLLISTSNDSIQSKFSLETDAMAAQAIRVFEVVCPSGTFDKTTGTEVFFKINENYGHAGAVFMRAVMDDLPAVKSRMRAVIPALDKASGVSNQDRFWSAYPAAMIVALEITNRLGLTNYNVAAFTKFCIDAIIGMRAGLKETGQTPVELLGEFLRVHDRNTLVLSSAGNGTTPALITKEPHDTLMVRNESYTNLIYIERAALRRWLQKRGVDPSALRAALTTAGMLLDGDAQYTLGKGTVWKGPQTRCWKLDSAHPEMGSSLHNAALTNAAAVAAQAIANAAATP